MAYDEDRESANRSLQGMRAKEVEARRKRMGADDPGGPINLAEAMPKIPPPQVGYPVPIGPDPHPATPFRLPTQGVAEPPMSDRERLMAVLRLFGLPVGNRPGIIASNFGGHK